MIKTLLVDDEILARNYIRGLIDWERLGFEICGEAVNGLEALEIVQQESPKLIITDINMAGMDGVALCKQVAQHYKEIRIIVLSSYDNYDFVRETMMHGAADYLLKHRIDASVLSELLHKVKREIEKERKLKQKEDFLAKNWNDINIELSQSYAKDLVLGSEEERRKAEQYFTNLSPIGTRNMMLCAMQVANFYLLTNKDSFVEKNKLIRSIMDLCKQNMLDMNGIVSDLEDGKFLFLFSFEQQKSEYAIKQRLHTCLRRIERSLSSFLNLKVIFGTSHTFRCFLDVRSCYELSCDSINEQQNMLLVGTAAPNGSGRAIFTLSLQQERDLLLAIEQADQLRVKFLIESLFAAMKSRGGTVNSIQFTVSELINLSEKAWRKLGDKDGHFYEGPYLTRNELSRFDRLDEIEAWTQRLFESLLCKLQRDPMDERVSMYVKTAKKYVQQHFKQTVSLEQAAEHAGITPAYLSRLFKQEVGVNFTDYLNQVRIEHAKQLIHFGNKKMKQIYKDVGFSSYNYFFKVFKDVAGMTPYTYASRSDNK